MPGSIFESSTLLIIHDTQKQNLGNTYFQLYKMKDTFICLILTIKRGPVMEIEYDRRKSTTCHDQIHKKQSIPRS